MTLLSEKYAGSLLANGMERDVLSGEFVALCPGCKAMQTLLFDNDKMTPTRKFSQHGGSVYHDCGASNPCRLYRSY